MYSDLPTSFSLRLIAVKTLGPIMNLLLTSFESWGAGSPLSSMRRDSLPICSRGCQSLCSDSMPPFCMTIFHQARTSGHQWNSFFNYFHLAFNARDLYCRGYKS